MVWVLLVANVVIKNNPVPMEMVGVEDRFGQVGAESFLREEYGLTAAHIVEAAKKAIALQERLIFLADTRSKIASESVPTYVGTAFLLLHCTEANADFCRVWK